MPRMRRSGMCCLRGRATYGLRWRLLLAVVAGALAVASLGEAAWLGAKAELGQYLIGRAWQRSQRGEEAPQPWPWADTQPVARLAVPAHGVELLVLAGGTGHTLAWGPGHLAGTAPVGAPFGNAVVAGHRDTHFGFLRELRRGDEIQVENAEGEQSVYRVEASYVTHDADSSVLEATEEARLTLVTCWPFDAPFPGGPERYVVEAAAVASD